MRDLRDILASHTDTALAGLGRVPTAPQTLAAAAIAPDMTGADADGRFEFGPGRCAAEAARVGGDFAAGVQAAGGLALRVAGAR